MVGCKGSYGTIKNLILPAALLGALTASRRYIRSAKVIVVLVTLFRAPTGVNSRGRTQMLHTIPGIYVRLEVPPLSPLVALVDAPAARPSAGIACRATVSTSTR